MGYTPGWLYESLPYLYLSTGFLLLWQLEHSMGILSGVLLILAGLLTGVSRWQYRRASARNLARRRARQNDDPITLRHYRD